MAAPGPRVETSVDIQSKQDGRRDNVMQMIRVIAAAAFVSLIASNAAADPITVDPGKTYTWVLRAMVEEFCKLNTSSVDSTGSSATVSFIENDSTNSTVALGDILGEDGMVQPWTADIKFGNAAAGTLSACNGGSFAVTVKSQHGYLFDADYSGPKVSFFTTRIPYNVALQFAGKWSPTVQSTQLSDAPYRMITGNGPVISQFEIMLTGIPNNGYVFSGTYSDVLTVTLAANT
jgi:hypothetical protein